MTKLAESDCDANGVSVFVMSPSQIVMSDCDTSQRLTLCHSRYTHKERTKLSCVNPLSKKPLTPLPLVLSFVGPDKKFKGVAAAQRSQMVAI
jgi:hypothetical protein